MRKVKSEKILAIEIGTRYRPFQRTTELLKRWRTTIAAGTHLIRPPEPVRQLTEKQMMNDN